MLCAKSQLIQRIQRKMNSNQIPSPNDAPPIFHRLKDISEKRMPSSDFKELTDLNIQKRADQNSQLQTSNSTDFRHVADIQQDDLPTASNIDSSHSDRLKNI